MDQQRQPQPTPDVNQLTAISKNYAAIIDVLQSGLYSGSASVTVSQSIAWLTGIKEQVDVQLAQRKGASGEAG